MTTTNIGTSIELCYSWNMQAPKIKVSLASELLLLFLKRCLYKGKKSDSIPSITDISTVGLLFAMNRKGCWEITSIGASFMDIIFPPNALKCKYLTVGMYFVTVMSWICFNFILLLHKKTASSRRQGLNQPYEGLVISALSALVRSLDKTNAAGVALCSHLWSSSEDAGPWH